MIMYTNVNGYLISNLTYKSGEQMEQLGKYGFLRRDYLKNNRNSTYQVIFLQDKEADQIAIDVGFDNPDPAVQEVFMENLNPVIRKVNRM